MKSEKQKDFIALIICNGKLSKRLIQKVIDSKKPRKQLLIAADGASEFLQQHKIIPAYIIGDLDSITPGVKNYFAAKKVKIIKIHDQNKNDLEKCIRFVISKKIKRISIVGLSGKRLDHTFNNISIIKKFFRKADITAYDNIFEYYFIKKKTEFEYKTGEIISLIALPKASGITSKGLKYPLKNGTLEFGGFQGALNSSTGKRLFVEVKKGTLLIFKKHFL